MIKSFECKRVPVKGIELINHSVGATMQSIERVFKLGDKVRCPLWETYALNHFGADEFEVRRVNQRYSADGKTRLVYDIAVAGLYIDAVEANELRLVRSV